MGVASTAKVITESHHTTFHVYKRFFYRIFNIIGVAAFGADIQVRLTQTAACLLVNYIIYNIIHNRAMHTTKQHSFAALTMFFEAFQPSTPLN